MSQTITNMLHGDILCRPDKRKNDNGVKWWCFVCKRYVKADEKHKKRTYRSKQSPIIAKQDLIRAAIEYGDKNFWESVGGVTYEVVDCVLSAEEIKMKNAIKKLRGYNRGTSRKF